METPERAPIPIHTCPRCDKQREEGLFREWRKPTKQRTVNCLICRLLMLSKTKTDDGTSERLKDAFRQELAVWLDARMGENKLSDGEKGRGKCAAAQFSFMPSVVESVTGYDHILTNGVSLFAP